MNLIFQFNTTAIEELLKIIPKVNQKIKLVKSAKNSKWMTLCVCVCGGVGEMKLAEKNTNIYFNMKIN